MTLSLSSLKRERQWRSATGFDRVRFEKLAVHFEAAYEDLHGQSMSERQADCLIPPKVTQCAELLFLPYFPLNQGLRTICWAWSAAWTARPPSGRRRRVWPCSRMRWPAAATPRPAASTTPPTWKPCWPRPTRCCSTPPNCASNAPRTRSGSGRTTAEKKVHAVKAMTASTPDRYIHFLSDTWEGKIHDYRLLKEELPPHLPWFKRVVVRVDSGYVGITKDYDCQEVIIPKKKPPRQELPAEDKAENKAKATQRIAVEHAFGGLKRYRILSDWLRMHDLCAHNIILGVCAGIWNFYITN